MRKATEAGTDADPNRSGVETPWEAPALPRVEEAGDARLVEQAREGDDRAFGTLVARYERALIRVLARLVRDVTKAGAPDRVVGTSKTVRSLARVCGAAPSTEGPFVQRVLRRDALAEIDFAPDDAPAPFVDQKVAARRKVAVRGVAPDDGRPRRLFKADVADIRAASPLDAAEDVAKTSDVA